MDRKACWELMKGAWGRVDIHHGPERFLRSFAEVPPELGHLVAAQWCQSEVCNGGFHQFFSNPTGVLAPEAAAAFAALGLTEAAALVQQAMGFFGASYPREQKVRGGALARREGKTRAEWDPFDDLNDPFYAAIKGYDEASNRYAAAYAAELGPSAE